MSSTVPACPPQAMFTDVMKGIIPASLARPSGVSRSPMSLFKSMCVIMLFAIEASEFLRPDRLEADHVAGTEQERLGGVRTIEGERRSSDQTPTSGCRCWIDACLAPGNPDGAGRHHSARLGQTRHGQAPGDRS